MDYLRIIGLTEQQLVIAEFVRKAGRHGVSAERLIDRMYNGCSNGGATTAKNVLAVQNRLIRNKLKKVGMNLVAERRGRSSAVYRLVRL